MIDIEVDGGLFLIGDGLATHNSVRDRPTSATEKIYLLTKNKSYYYDADAVREACSDDSGWAKQRAKGDDTHQHIYGTRWNQELSSDHVVQNNPAGRNMWNYWLLGPEPYAGAHFATFPTEIPRRAIKAGTSEKGACPECGAGWVRVVERGAVQEHPARLNRVNDAKQFHKDNGDYGDGGSLGRMRVNSTTGWRPGCECGHEPVPSVVLDPFAGSGTVGVVCQELGREFVGLDLSAEYLQLARERTGAKAWDEWHNGIKAEEVEVTDLPLFS